MLGGTTGGLKSADVQGMLSVTAGAIAADPTDANNLGWTFNSTPQAFNFLAAGESLTLTYTVRANDGTVNSNDQTVTITITGTNDAPVITVGSGDSAAATLPETNAALSTSGTLTLTDADVSNRVTATVVTGVTLGGTTGGLNSADVQGMLSVTAGAIAADPTDANNLGWTFNSTPQAFNFLAACESLTLTYTLRANDGTVNSNDQTVPIPTTCTIFPYTTLFRSGDSAAATLPETNAALSTSGTLTL